MAIPDDVLWSENRMFEFMVILRFDGDDNFNVMTVTMSEKER